MIFSVGDNYSTIVANNNPFDPFELTIGGTPRTQHGQKTTIRIEHLYSIIAAICNCDKPLIVDGDTSWIFEFPFVKSFGTEREQKVAAVVENLNPMVATVRDKKLILFVDCDEMGILKLAFFATVHAKFATVRAVGLKHLNSVIIFITNVYKALTVGH